MWFAHTGKIQKTLSVEITERRERGRGRRRKRRKLLPSYRETVMHKRHFHSYFDSISAREWDSSVYIVKIKFLFY